MYTFQNENYTEMYNSSDVSVGPVRIYIPRFILNYLFTFILLKLYKKPISLYLKGGPYSGADRSNP